MSGRDEENPSSAQNTTALSRTSSEDELILLPHIITVDDMYIYIVRRKYKRAHYTFTTTRTSDAD